jgi:hypothetical protein
MEKEIRIEEGKMGRIREHEQVEAKQNKKIGRRIFGKGPKRLQVFRFEVKTQASK